MKSLVDKIKGKFTEPGKISQKTKNWLEEMKKLEERQAQITEVRVTGSFKNEDMEIHLKFRYNDGEFGYKSLKLIHPLKVYHQGNVEADPIRFNQPMYETVMRWKEMIKTLESGVFNVSLDRHATLRDYLTSMK